MTTSTLQVLGCGAPAEAEGGRACGPRSGRPVASSEPGSSVPVGPPGPTRGEASPRPEPEGRLYPAPVQAEPAGPETTTRSRG